MPLGATLQAGTYTLEIADRPGCGGFLTGSSCQQALALTLRRRLPNLRANQTWSISTAQAQARGLQGAAVTLSTKSWTSAACRPGSYVLATTGSVCTSGALAAVSGRQQSVGAQWVLEGGPGGAFYIRPKGCADKYLGLPRSCAVGNRVGIVPKGGPNALLWRLRRA